MSSTNFNSINHLSIILLILLTIVASFTAHADSESDESNTIFNWAETDYPQYFSPSGATTQIVFGYIARYYSETDSWIATFDGQVFVYGEIFNDMDPAGLSIKSVGSVESYLALALANFDPSGWTEETHSKNVDPNFSEVFDDTQVKRFDFTISEDQWQNILEDMINKYGTFGQRSFPGSGLIDTGEDPIFVPANVYYNGTQWYNVGIRFKGNSSLQNSWQQGILKLSFKMDLDEYEDDYPQIKNQRFFGFKKFSLKNNFDDKSLLREKVAADVFANAGLTVSHTAFYTLYIDHGNGPEYFGLYTLVEEVDGTVLDTQFESDDGNLYKPEGDGATFAEGSFNETDFEKETNEDDADWSDIITLFEVLHDNAATSDSQTWRTNLEAIFDVDVFLKYLAVNEVIQNWDTSIVPLPREYFRISLS